MLAVNFSEIGNEEGVFVTRLAEFVVDCLDTLVKGLTNQMFANRGAVAVEGFGDGMIFHREVIMIEGLGMMLDEGGCNDHILGSDLDAVV